MLQNDELFVSKLIGGQLKLIKTRAKLFLQYNKEKKGENWPFLICERWGSDNLKKETIGLKKQHLKANEYNELPKFYFIGSISIFKLKNYVMIKHKNNIF